MLWPSKNSAKWAKFDHLEGRAVGAYLGLAIGDALGATVEFMVPEEIVAKYKVHDTIRGGGWLYLKPGQVTDDTAMSLVLGQAILADGGEVVAQSVGRSFDDWMRTKPVDIGDTVRRGIIQFRNKGITEVPCDEWGGGNGACMRTLPVALVTYGRDDGEMICASRTQAHITHHNHHSDAGTECVNRIIHGCLDGADKNRLLNGPVQDLIAAYPEFRFRRKRPNKNPSAYIVDTLRVVFECFFDTSHFEECLVEVVNRGGDADTTGAIAGAIAGAFYGGPEAIPKKWLKKLDQTIHDQCIHQALDLIHLARTSSMVRCGPVHGMAHGRDWSLPGGVWSEAPRF
ncbi:MAG: ADP-ribosyl-[dinitrogen reductase] hydrolase [Magnetococcales bacterium]|nr:ADP-ribosyl-[dinitrogen reductase] hydrolase [Magnetococcales bacterium]